MLSQTDPDITHDKMHYHKVIEIVCLQATDFTLNVNPEGVEVGLVIKIVFILIPF
jgi:hypothetical protein